MAKKGEIVEHGVLQIRKQVIQDMKDLGTYQPAFDMVINIYADMLYHYNRVQQEFVASGFETQTTTAAGGTKKSALAHSLESLRKDILYYSDRLQLNPKTMDIEQKVKDDEKPTGLAAVLKLMNEQGK